MKTIKTKKIPHLYLDMDGVQADFFGAWADKHGVSHWKAIDNKENEIELLANSTPEQVYSFFRNLKPLPGGMEIIKWVQEHNIPYTVLSAPLRGPYADASKQAKKDWLDEHHHGSSDNAIFTSQKQKYAVKDDVPNVLVDDFGPYIKKWTDAGGIPVKHEDESEVPTAANDTISQLEQIYSPFLNK
jgi:2-hydroxy-3-keto-5-methylthiopentenyl-1-phosphate phosphatase